MSHYSILSLHSQWIIGAGEIRFWKDNWAGEYLEGPQPCDETLTVAHGFQVLEELQELIPTRLMTTIRNIQLDNSHTDHLLFTGTNSGKFKLKAIKALLHPQGTVRRWAKGICRALTLLFMACDRKKVSLSEHM